MSDDPIRQRMLTIFVVACACVVTLVACQTSVTTETCSPELASAIGKGDALYEAHSYYAAIYEYKTALYLASTNVATPRVKDMIRDRLGTCFLRHAQSQAKANPRAALEAALEADKYLPGRGQRLIGQLKREISRADSHSLMYDEFHVSERRRESKEHGVILLSIDEDMTTTIWAVKAGSVLKAKPGEFFSPGGLGLKLISVSKERNQAVLSRTWCELGK